LGEVYQHDAAAAKPRSTGGLRLGLATWDARGVETFGTRAVQSLWAAFASGGVDALLAHVEPDAELVPAMVGRGVTLRGHDEIRRWYASMAADGRRVESTLYGTELHGEHVLVHGGLRVIDRGGLLDSQVFWLLWLRDGRVRRAESFTSRARALQALGAVDTVVAA
jgi:ketosteroid isomerase-like protein